MAMTAEKPRTPRLPLLGLLLLATCPADAADKNAAAGPDGFALRSVEITLPQSDRQFPGDGADAINANCLTCHSAGMVLRQPHLPPEKWNEIVNKMIKVYKAPIDPGDVAAIEAYLAKR